MDLQQHLRDYCTNKTLVVVGNAPFSKDRSALIDSHDVVFRFNQFSRQWFLDGLIGRKLHCWFNNLVRDRETKEWRGRHCELAKVLNPSVLVGTPHENDHLNRLRSACKFYPVYGLDFLFPDTGLDTPFLRKQPTTGFYTAFRLLQLEMPLTVIGFTGQVSRHHDGEGEMAYLRSQSQVLLHMDF